MAIIAISEPNRPVDTRVILDPFADDDDWAALQTSDDVKTAGGASIVRGRGTAIAIYIKWFDADGNKVPGRGSFNFQAVKLDDGIVVDGAVVGGEGYRGYIIDDIGSADIFTCRFTSIVEPLNAIQLILRMELLIL